MNKHPSQVLAGQGLEEVIFHQHALLPPRRASSAGPHVEVSCIITCFPLVMVLAGLDSLKVVVAEQGSCAY